MRMDWVQWEKMGTEVEGNRPVVRLRFFFQGGNKNIRKFLIVPLYERVTDNVISAQSGRFCRISISYSETCIRREEIALSFAVHDFHSFQSVLELSFNVPFQRQAFPENERGRNGEKFLENEYATLLLPNPFFFYSQKKSGCLYSYGIQALLLHFQLYLQYSTCSRVKHFSKSFVIVLKDTIKSVVDQLLNARIKAISTIYVSTVK